MFPDPTSPADGPLLSDDPRPDWPDEENAWREMLMQENDDWNDEIPTVHLGDDGPPSPDEPNI